MVGSRVVGAVTSVLDLHIDHDLFVSSSDPSLNDHLHYTNDLDGPLHDLRVQDLDQVSYTGDEKRKQGELRREIRYP